MSLLSPIWKIVSLAAGMFILDRLVKLLAQSGAPIFGGLIHLQLPNASSLFNNGFALGAELIGLALCALIVIFSAKHASTIRSAAFGLIVGGLAANLFDRVAYGLVMNYLHVGNLPVFNLAHIALVAGAVSLAVAIVMTKSDQNTERESLAA